MKHRGVYVVANLLFALTIGLSPALASNGGPATTKPAGSGSSGPGSGTTPSSGSGPSGPGSGTLPRTTIADREKPDDPPESTTIEPPTAPATSPTASSQPTAAPTRGQPTTTTAAEVPLSPTSPSLSVPQTKSPTEAATTRVTNTSPKSERTTSATTSRPKRPDPTVDPARRATKSSPCGKRSITLDAQTDHGAIRVRASVTPKAGVTWTTILLQDRRITWRGPAVRGLLDRRVSDLTGAETVTIRMTHPNGAVCTVEVLLPG